ncbi:UNVERIFIED_CONTAM: hypothetical protein GTU68_060201 [Idotea baltica]|nr:hypothetical protein [Idotea baltica]
MHLEGKEFQYQFTWLMVLSCKARLNLLINLSLSYETLSIK